MEKESIGLFKSKLTDSLIYSKIYEKYNEYKKENEVESQDSVKEDGETTEPNKIRHQPPRRASDFSEVVERDGTNDPNNDQTQFGKYYLTKSPLDENLCEEDKILSNFRRYVRETKGDKIGGRQYRQCLRYICVLAKFWKNGDDREYLYDKLKVIFDDLRKFCFTNAAEVHKEIKKVIKKVEKKDLKENKGSDRTEALREYVDELFEPIKGKWIELILIRTQTHSFHCQGFFKSSA